jgi:hypothetical protein
MERGENKRRLSERVVRRNEALVDASRAKE